MRIKQSNNFYYWSWFEANKQGELYYVIDAMIKDKIEEILSQKIEEVLHQKIDGLSVNIQTAINGKNITNFRDSIAEMIIDELSK